MSEWFAELPTDDERAWWKVAPGTLPVLSKWPHPNSKRVNAGFRLTMEPDFFPYSSRYFIDWKGWIDSPGQGDPDIQRSVWLDLNVITNGVYIFGGAPRDPVTNAFLNFSIKEVDNLPTFSGPGRDMVFVLFDTPQRQTRVTYEFSDVGGGGLRWNANHGNSVIRGGTNFTGPAWPWDDNRFEWYPVPECYEFPPPGITIDDPGFAEFNGIDSYISLDQALFGFETPYIFDVDIRLHDTTGFWPMMGREATGAFYGMDDNDIINCIGLFPTTWTPILDTWFHFRYEFEQTGQLQHQLFIDQISVFNSPAVRMFCPWENLGVYKHNNPDVIWMNGDMRNLKIWQGAAPSTDVILDMPLILNATDHGPLGNHGTTFNMRLPSV